MVDAGRLFFAIVVLLLLSACASQPPSLDRARQEWIGEIQAKVRSHLAMPPGTPPGIMAVYRVVQLPTGEVLKVDLVRSSGHDRYDAATEKAIHASSPLPKAPAGVFHRDLELRFQP